MSIIFGNQIKQNKKNAYNLTKMYLLLQLKCNKQLRLLQKATKYTTEHHKSLQ